MDGQVQADYDLAVAVFAAREAPRTLSRVIELAIAASVGTPRAVIDVLVNGNEMLAEACVSFLYRSSESVRIRRWFLSAPDKAMTFNWYLHELAVPSAVHLFVDGYARINRDAPERLRHGLARPQALAATGVPTAGPSAARIRRQMLAEGGIHGNLFALAGSTTVRLRETFFRLPVGIYRTDGTLGAALNFNLDPSAFAWDPSRIAVVDGAHWSVGPAPWCYINALRYRGARLRRQAQGDLENLAVRAIFRDERRPISALPADAASLVNSWVDNHPDASERLLRSRRYRDALTQLRERSFPAGTTAALLHDSASDT